MSIFVSIFHNLPKKKQKCWSARGIQKEINKGKVNRLENRLGLQNYGDII